MLSSCANISGSYLDSGRGDGATPVVVQDLTFLRLQGPGYERRCGIRFARMLLPVQARKRLDKWFLDQ